MDFDAWEEERDIEFSRLVAFVKNPVKFFFERRLGVNFSEQEESIADSENFALDNALEKYAIHAELVEFDGDQTNAFFARQKVKVCCHAVSLLPCMLINYWRK